MPCPNIDAAALSSHLPATAMPETKAPPAECDVLIVGGGPAGATLAALLARRGRDVTLVEKSRHPRFHIGESLLPANVPLLQDLGLADDVARIGMRKLGVEFVSPNHEAPSVVEFREAWNRSMPFAWHVRRSEFDELLFRHAGRLGARAIEGWRVERVDFDAAGALARVVGDNGSTQACRARYVVDASGRDTLLAGQLGTKRRNRRHNSAALYAHFTGARRLPEAREGHISILWFPHGWFWFIPLADGTTSVGAVCWPRYLKSRTKPLPEFFRDTVALCPALHDRLKDAELVEGRIHATGNYAYASSRCTGPRWAMIGDAYAFIDPVFSSGVFLAMKSAYAAVDLVETTLDRPREAARARRRFEALAQHGPRQFSWFIYRVTNPTMREFFMTPGNPMRLKEALLSLLAGDIYGDTPIWPTLKLMKVLYYLVSALHPGRTWRAWRRRRADIRDVGVIAP